MARPLRIEFPGAYYHVMNRGLDRQPVFQRDEDHERFIDLLEDIARRWGVRIFAYCCMPNHYHLFLQTPQGNLSRVMRHVDGLYTQRYNRSRGRDGPLLRGRYRAEVVDADAYSLQLVRYIHLNPVEAGLVGAPGDYPWSSHCLYRSRHAPSWLVSAEVLGHFAGKVRAFERFVAEGNSDALQAHFEQVRRSPFLASGDFLSRAIRGARVSRENPRSEQTPQFPSLEAVLEKVAGEAGVRVADLGRGRLGHHNGPRNLAIWVSSRVAGFSHRAIRERFGLGSDSAVTRVCQRMHVRLGKDRELARLSQRVTTP